MNSTALATLKSLFEAARFRALTVNAATVLLHASEGPVRMSDCAEACNFSTAAATGLIDVMEKKGLVQRGPNPEATIADRRAVWVTITPAGAEALAELADALEPAPLALGS